VAAEYIIIIIIIIIIVNDSGREAEGRRERRTDGFCYVFLVTVCGERERGTLLLRSAVVVLPIKTYRHNGNVAHIHTHTPKAAPPSTLLLHAARRRRPTTGT